MREMKDSGSEWIGAIPQDWKTDRLQWHLKEINVSNNPIQTKNILSLTIEAGVIPYAEKGNQGNKAKEDYSQYKIAFPDTLVIRCTESSGYLQLFKEIMDFVNNLNAVVGEYIHLFNQQIGQLGV